MTNQATDFYSSLVNSQDHYFAQNERSFMINSTNLYWFIDFVILKEYQYSKVVLFTVFVIKLKQPIIIAIKSTSKWYYIDLINFHTMNSNSN